MKLTLGGILISLIAVMCQGQSINGFVKDLKTKEALPYVHIGVLNKNFGVISADDGSFSIDLSKANASDLLVFSSIGYESYKLEVGSIKGNPLTIFLEPKVYVLNEIVVKSKKIKVVKLGRVKPSHWTTGQSGFKEFGFGAERGLQVIVPANKKFQVLDARFHLRFNSVDSILFRVNVYTIKNGNPHESLLKKDAFVTSKKNMHWVICNLENENLIIDSNVVITYEIVRWWFNQSDNEIFMTHGSGYDEGGIFYRLSSQDQWKTDRNSTSFPVTMYLSAEEVK
jgi:hypothetical protein